MDMPMYQEAIAHFMTGVAVSFADRATSENAKRHTETRKKNKLKELSSLNYLLATDQMEGSEETKKSQQYYDAIANAREYFRMEPMDDPQAGEVMSFVSRVKQTISNYIRNERINELPLSKKLMAAFGIEFIADAGVAFSQIAFGKGNGLVAVGESLYQGPSLFLGLVTGKGLLYAKGMFRSKQEKELDRLAGELTADGKLAEIVKSYLPENYQAPAKVGIYTYEQPGIEHFKEKVIGKIRDAEGRGKGLVADVRRVLIEDPAARRKEKEDAEKKRREDIKKRYGDY